MSGEVTNRQPPADWELISVKTPPTPSPDRSRAWTQLLPRGCSDLSPAHIDVSPACKLQTLLVSAMLQINGEPNLRSAWVLIELH